MFKDNSVSKTEVSKEKRKSKKVLSQCNNRPATKKMSSEEWMKDRVAEMKKVRGY